MSFAEVENTNPRPYWMQFLFTGQMFYASQEFSIVPSGYSRIEAVIPSNKVIHLIRRTIQAIADGPIIVRLYEDPSGFTDGTTTFEVVTNMDRRSNKTPDLVLYSDPTAPTNIGTLLTSDMITVTGLPNSTGTLVAGITEFIFKPSSKYILTIQNLGGTTTSRVMVNYLWYESSN